MYGRSSLANQTEEKFCSDDLTRLSKIGVGVVKAQS